MHLFIDKRLQQVIVRASKQRFVIQSRTTHADVTKHFVNFLQPSRLTLKALQPVLFLSQMSAIFAFIFQAYNIALDEKSNSISDKFRFTFEMYICAPLLRIRLHYLDFFIFYLCKQYSYYIMRRIFNVVHDKCITQKNCECPVLLNLRTVIEYLTD